MKINLLSVFLIASLGASAAYPLCSNCNNRDNPSKRARDTFENPTSRSGFSDSSSMIADRVQPYCRYESEPARRLIEATQKRIHNANLTGDYKTQAMVRLQSAKAKFNTITQDRYQTECRNLYSMVARELKGLDQILERDRLAKRKARA